MLRLWNSLRLLRSNFRTSDTIIISLQILQTLATWRKDYPYRKQSVGLIRILVRSAFFKWKRCEQIIRNHCPAASTYRRLPRFTWPHYKLCLNCKAYETAFRCQAKFLTSHHVCMHRVIFYIPNTLTKLIIRA